MDFLPIAKPSGFSKYNEIPLIFRATISENASYSLSRLRASS